MLSIKLFRLVFCLFRFNQNIETLCIGIEAKQPKCFVSNSAKTSFGSSFVCFASKLVSNLTSSKVSFSHEDKSGNFLICLVNKKGRISTVMTCIFGALFTAIVLSRDGAAHRLNMELYLQSLFGLHVHSCTHWLRPRHPPPTHLGSYTRALLVSQDRRHLFVTP
jgi:hypothetical protein